MIKFKYFSIAVIMAIAFTACKKEGLGGKGEIKGQTVSYTDGKYIKGSTVYIKYGAKSFPGTNIANYDASNTADSDGKYDFKGLRKGDYYLYATGMENGMFVSGNMRIVLNDDELKENVNIVLSP